MWPDGNYNVRFNAAHYSLGTIRDFDLKLVFNKHEAEWSEFDCFRLCLIGAPYQKKYGYSYENCMRFSRVKLREMFLLEFQFQQESCFDTEKDKASYYLWEIRRHVVMESRSIARQRSAPNIVVMIFWSHQAGFTGRLMRNWMLWALMRTGLSVIPYEEGL